MTRVPVAPRSLVGLLREDLAALEELLALEPRPFLLQRHLRASLLYHLLAAGTAVRQLARAVVERHGLRAPIDDRTTFLLLEEAGILRPDSAWRLITLDEAARAIAAAPWQFEEGEVLRAIEGRLEAVWSGVAALEQQLAVGS